ncbi:hypothetical protein ABIA32_002748 [Streptacidiphilus sp. MAP12-20]|uniref:hypothetical protein n=1 Tax=Streptacidiphilus sp. MAP12-20 TaxID=3156299 RepID=UPI003511B514
MSSLPDAVTREAVLKTLLDVIDTEYKTVRIEVQQLLDEAAASSGLNGADAKLPDGTKVAKVSISEPKPAAVVTNQVAFRDWVREHHAHQLHSQLVVEVRPAFATALLGEITAAGVPEWCDRETGEVHTVPGVEIKATRARSHSVRFEKSGRADVAAAWRAGQLADLVTLALPTGPAGDGAE